MKRQQWLPRLAGCTGVDCLAETRGMHKRTDYQQQDPSQQHYVISGGLDQVWVKTAPIALQTEAKRALVAL